jgi:ceramide glucosyltransferase
MIHCFRQMFEIVTVVGTGASVGYYLLCLWSAWDYLQYRKRVVLASSGPELVVRPPVSILKPLKGADPEIYETFRTYCLQDYGQYEIVFGISMEDDPAVPFVLRLQQEFPNIPIRLVMCSEKLGLNTKVSNLAQMLNVACHELVIVNDSDIRVGREYLRRVVAPLADASVGMVTCLYRGIAAPTLGSKLESLGISTDFAAGVLVARLIEGGVRFGLGSTLAFRRGNLESIGGFESMTDHLSDDYELGRRLAARGLGVQLSEVVVETFLPPYDVRGFFSHQLRWARAVRDSRRLGYVGLLFTFGLAWAALAVVASWGARWGWVLFGVVVLLRLCVAWVVGGTVLHDRQVIRWFCLLPLRDLLAVVVWIASFAGNRILWRGEWFELKDGKLSRGRSEG